MKETKPYKSNRNFKDELQKKLLKNDLSWAMVADSLGKERNNVRRNINKWLIQSEAVLNAMGYTIKLEKLKR